MIAAGANLNLRDEKEFTALTSAARFGNTEIVRSLIAAGATVNPIDEHWITAEMRLQ